MSETTGYSFTPKQSQILHALEGLSPFKPVIGQNDFSRDVAGAYAIGDENTEAPATSAFGALKNLGASGLQAYAGNVEQQQALAAEERKHSRALDIEQIRSARSSDATQKRIQYLRESAAQRLQDVGANKKPPRRMIGQPPTAPSRGGGDIEDEETYDGTDPLDPNLNEDLRDIPPVEPDLPTKDEEDLPDVQEEGSLFNLTPPPFLPSGSDVIPAGAMRINPQQAAQVATAQVGGAPQPLPSSAMGLPLTDLAGPISIAYIPSETNRQMQELQQGVRDLTPSTAGAPLAQMAPPTPAAPTEFPAEFVPGPYPDYNQARQVAEMPLPEDYERPEIVPKVDDATGETYFEVMPPKKRAESDRLALEKAKIELEKSKGGAVGPDTDEEQRLRKEFIAASKDYMVVQNAWANIRSASRMAESGGEGAGDLAMIFSFMKLLDPGSVVREQEFANAQNAAGVPDRIRAEYNRLLTGGRLAPDQRKNFVKQGKSLFMERQRGQTQLANIYTRLAEQSGARPTMVAIDLKTPDPLGDAESQVRAKVVEMTGLDKGTDEYNTKFDELKKLLAQKKMLEAEMESAIAVD
jgi:hypothetical protein